LIRRLLPAVALLVLCLAAGLWQPYDPHGIDLSARLLSPSYAHWLGTDDLGRDVLSRLMAGAPATVVVLLVVTGVATATGVLLGLAAAVCGGAVERLVLRLADLAMVIPQLVLALAVTALFGLGPLTAGMALALAAWGPYAVTTHALARHLAARPFVMAAVALGAGPRWLALVHLLPNLRPALGTFVATDAARAVVNYAALAFVGLGADTGRSDWGALLFEYRGYAIDAPLLLLWPGLATALVALSFAPAFDHDGQRGR